MALLFGDGSAAEEFVQLALGWRDAEKRQWRGAQVIYPVPRKCVGEPLSWCGTCVDKTFVGRKLSRRGIVFVLPKPSSSSVPRWRLRARARARARAVVVVVVVVVGGFSKAAKLHTAGRNKPLDP